MQTVFKKIFDIREGEAVRAILMFFYIFLVIASLLIIKPVRNSIFLTILGPSKLPYAFVLVAFYAGLFTYLYSKLTLKFRLNVVIRLTNILSIVILIIFWLLLNYKYRESWFIYVFYIWVAGFGGITTAQFWLLANYVFNAREAKRLFGFIGAGAISGGIFGGYLTNYLAPIMGTQNMLFICILFLTLCMVFLQIVWHKSARFSYREKVLQQKRIQFSEVSKNPLKLISRSRHLLYLTALIGVGVLVANLVDYQYNLVASNSINDEDKLTAFFGFWSSTMNVISLMIQLFMTRRLLQSFGVGSSLFFLPLGIMLGSFAILISPALWSAIAIKISDGGFKQSINKSSLELLYLPVPMHIKNKVKTFIDVFVDSIATGFGGILLIIFTIGLNITVSQVSLINILLISLWIFLIIKIRKEYIESFRMAIERRTINIEQESVNIEDALVFKNLMKVLESNNERQILYVLNLLETIKNEDFLQYYRKLLVDPSTDVKIKILKILQQYSYGGFLKDVIKLVDDESQNVKVEAIQYLFTHSEDKHEILENYLNHPDFYIQGATLIVMAREIRQNNLFEEAERLKAFIEREFLQYLENESNDNKTLFIKMNTAEIIGTANLPELYPLLNKLMRNQPLEVIQKSFIHAGKTQGKEFVPHLISKLSTKHLKNYAREALVNYGEDVMDELLATMQGKTVDRNIRLAIPRVMAMISSQRSVNELIENLKHGDSQMKSETLKALNRLKAKFPMLKFNNIFIEQRIMDELKLYYQVLIILYEQNNHRLNEIEMGLDDENIHKVTRARKLLVTALEEKLDDNLNRIFRLLGLKYSPRDIINAYQGIMSEKSEYRANAIEFLDNILELHLKRLIIPVVEATSYEILVSKSEEFFGYEIPKETDCLEILINGNDNWLKCCALFLLAELKLVECKELAQKMLEDSDSVVNEMAQYAINNINS
jgi:AAA family ATP:ADP antiporter